MKHFLILIGCLTLAYAGMAQSLTALHNNIRDDSVYNTPEKQVKLIKSLGFAGMEINQVERFAAFFPVMQREGLPVSFFYVKVDLDSGAITPALWPCIRQLKGTRALLAPYIVSSKNTYASSDTAGNPLSVRLIRQLADSARQSGLDVALYPHIWFWLERAEHATSLVRQSQRTNVGLLFNLPHWLATTPFDRENTWQQTLQTVRPYLKMVTICGASGTANRDRNTLWDYYIQPLGKGSFDTYAVVNYLVNDLHYRGAFGLQAYNLKGDKVANMQHSLTVWNQWKKRLSREQ